MKNNIEELTLLLMYLTSWEEESPYYDENNNFNKYSLKNAWKGYSEHYVTPGYEKYDYRKFNIKSNNKKLKGLVLEIKNGYEVGE